MRAFGAVLGYDPLLLAFERLDMVDEQHWVPSEGRQAPLLRVLQYEPGEIVIGNGIVAGDVVVGKGILAEMPFRLIGSAKEARLKLAAGFVGQGQGQSRWVEHLGSAWLLPHVYLLGANFSNPFNHSTSIEYALPRRMVLVK